MSRRTFDEITDATEHVKPVHPWRELVSNHFYLDSLVSTEGGLWIVLMDALLLVPLVMAAFFYPVPAMIWAAVLLIVTFGGYEGYVFWRRRHPM
jgi:hypothetical protein